MGIADDAVQIRARGWRTLAALHGLIEVALERELQARHDLSVVENLRVFQCVSILNGEPGDVVQDHVHHADGPNGAV